MRPETRQSSVNATSWIQGIAAGWARVPVSSLEPSGSAPKTRRRRARIPPVIDQPAGERDGAPAVDVAANDEANSMWEASVVGLHGEWIPCGRVGVSGHRSLGSP